MHSQESGPISQGGSKPDLPSLFSWRLQWGLSVFQWGSNPHNPSPIFTLPTSYYPLCGNQKVFAVKCRRNIVKIKYWFRFLPRDAKQARPFAVIQCLSVCLSVTFVDSVKTNKRIFKNFHHRIAKPF